MTPVLTYRSKCFRITELVSRQIYQERGDRAWELLQPAALRTLDLLREKFGRIVINNWNVQGPYNESGLRHFETGTGAEWSMHKFGGAFDCKFQDTTPQDAHAYILANPDQFPELTTLEAIKSTPTWLHFDVRNHGKRGIWVVNP